MTPTVTILLPARDAQRTLDAALHSIARQTFARWECLVVDDGSRDDTVAMVRRAGERDGRFRLLERPHAGLVAALNAGIERCRGRYVARMDADDLMHRLRLAEQVALLDSREELAAVGCHVRTFPRDTLAPGARDYESWLNSIDSETRLAHDAFIECPVAHPTLMIRRDVLRAFAYRDRGWPEDYDLILRLLVAGHRIGVVPRRRLLWRRHPGNLSRLDARYDLQQFTACKAAFLARSFLADDVQYLLWGYGATGRQLRRALLAHGRRPALIVEVHPGRLGNRIHGAPVVGPEELPPPGQAPLIVSVAGATARSQIRGWLERAAWKEGSDYLCAA